MEMKVYITDTGKRYHKNKSCVTNPKDISLNKALAKGLKPCQKCAKDKNNYNQKNRKFPQKKDKKKFSIKSNEPDSIIFESSIMNKQEISDNKYILEQSSQSNNNIINQNSDRISKSLEQSSNIFDNNENIKINDNEISVKNVFENEDKKRISKNINDKNNKKEENFYKKIQEDIEKDKLRRKNYIKKMEFIPKGQIINKEEINQIEESKEEDFSPNQNQKKLNSIIRVKSLCGIGDMGILNQTIGEAINIPYNDINLFNQSNFQKGIFKFTFEIKDLKPNQTAFIEVGFYIKYINTFDLNYRDKNLIKYQKEKIKMGTFSDNLQTTKNLFIQKNTEKVYVFININKGKLFIIGENELQKRINNVFLNKENAEIFYVKNFGIIFFYQILSIEPILEFDENTSKICSIKLNEQKIN